eukprot:1324775-Amphidinium_carterae.2
MPSTRSSGWDPGYSCARGVRLFGSLLLPQRRYYGHLLPSSTCCLVRLLEVGHASHCSSSASAGSVALARQRGFWSSRLWSRVPHQAALPASAGAATHYAHQSLRCQTLRCRDLVVTGQALCSQSIATRHSLVLEIGIPLVALGRASCGRLPPLRVRAVQWMDLTLTQTRRALGGPPELRAGHNRHWERLLLDVPMWVLRSITPATVTA